MQENLYNSFINDFSDVMCNLADGNQYSNIIFLCIGTDRITGDSFGPLVGYKLKSLFFDAKRIDIIGDLENPVNATNISDIARQINENYTNPFIIAIDSAMSNTENIGTILVNKGPLSVRNKLKQNVYLCRTHEY